MRAESFHNVNNMKQSQKMWVIANFLWAQEKLIMECNVMTSWKSVEFSLVRNIRSMLRSLLHVMSFVSHTFNPNNARLALNFCSMIVKLKIDDSERGKTLECSKHFNRCSHTIHDHQDTISVELKCRYQISMQFTMCAIAFSHTFQWHLPSPLMCDCE